MQRVFGFRGGLVDWADVEEFFGTIWTLGTPHRWNRVGEPDFGLWVLRNVKDYWRTALLTCGLAPRIAVDRTLGGSIGTHTAAVGGYPAPASASTLLVINAGMEVDSAAISHDAGFDWQWSSERTCPTFRTGRPGSRPRRALHESHWFLSLPTRS